ncbi:MAG: hypothetical protein JWR50_2108 [Mucilaginibacter sp.]|nr:hypothetical protein [Mucilaginibacter sp.]
MKKKITIYSALVSVGLLLSTGCTKDFSKLNTDPTAFSATNFDPNYLLTTAQLDYTGSQDFSYDTWRANLIYSSTLIQGFATSIGYWAGDKYLLNNTDYTAAYWESPGGGDGAYSEQVKQIVDVLTTTDGKPQYNNLHQIARITKALIFERITDLYGDVPYSEAGQGFYKKILFPKYDAQKDIYNDLIAELKDATAKLDPKGDIPSGDAIYHGNIAQWQRFGNSLLLRVGMRLVKVDPTTAKAVAASVVGKTMIDGDDAFVKNDATGGRPTVNRVSQVLLGGPENQYVKWSQTFIDILQGKTKHTDPVAAIPDPRLAVISVTKANIGVTGGDNNPADQKGQPNGYDLSGTAGLDISSAPGYTTLDAYSNPSTNLIGLGAPTFIFTYGESELLLADAAERFGVGGDAATHYKQGVEAAMTYLKQYNASATISLADADKYITANPYVAGETGLKMINTQIWELTNTMLDFYESWANWRRTGYPVLTPVNYPGNVTGGTIPRRFPYPLYEASSNPTNYTAAHNAVPGGDGLAGRVWWDSK